MTWPTRTMLTWLALALTLVSLMGRSTRARASSTVIPSLLHRSPIERAIILAGADPIALCASIEFCFPADTIIYKPVMIAGQRRWQERVLHSTHYLLTRQQYVDVVADARELERRRAHPVEVKWIETPAGQWTLFGGGVVVGVSFTVLAIWGASKL